jgi:hypothetical protein
VGGLLNEQVDKQYVSKINMLINLEDPAEVPHSFSKHAPMTFSKHAPMKPANAQR